MMAKALRFYGEFLTIKNRVVRVEIWKDKADEDTWTAEGIEFEADNSVLIEWDEKDKTEPMRTSHATLNMMSDENRQFVELYAVKWDEVRVDIYIDTVLYWSGYVDSEIYEEPYSTEKGYVVPITCSDLAGLDRKKWSGTGLKSIATIWSEIIASSGLNIAETVRYTSLMWGAADGGTVMDWNNIYIDSGNWYDEDGEAMSMYSVMEELLRGLSMCIQQRAGKLYLYDLEGLRTNGATEALYWSDTDAALSADRVMNNVKVTFSPYGSTSLLDQTVSYHENDADEVNEIPINGDMENGALKNPHGFLLRTGTGGVGLLALNGAKYFKTTPEQSGDKHTGILIKWQQYFYDGKMYPRNSEKLLGLAELGQTLEPEGLNNYAKYNLQWHEPGTAFSALNEIVRSKRVYIPYLHNTSYQLRLKADMLLDFVLNPFEGGNGVGNKETDNLINSVEEVNYIYIPVKIRLWDGQDDAATLKEGYTLTTPYTNNSYEHTDGDNWTKAAAASAIGYLCFYSPDNFDHDNGITGGKGFCGNRWMIGYTSSIPANVKKLDDGEYLKTPYESGWCDITIMDGIYMLDSHKRTVRTNYNAYLAWYLVKSLSLELVDQYGKDIEIEDVEDKAYINTYAKEGEDVEVKIGTSGTLPPLCLGVLKRADYTNIATLARAGTEDTLSRLVINNYYSQYADRCFRLSGTASLPTSDKMLFTDANTSGLFMPLSRRDMLREEESELGLVQLREEHYCASNG